MSDQPVPLAAAAGMRSRDDMLEENVIGTLARGFRVTVRRTDDHTHDTVALPAACAGRLGLWLGLPPADISTHSNGWACTRGRNLARSGSCTACPSRVCPLSMQVRIASHQLASRRTARCAVPC